MSKSFFLTPLNVVFFKVWATDPPGKKIFFLPLRSLLLINYLWALIYINVFNFSLNSILL